MLDMSYHHLYPDHIKAKLRTNIQPISLLVRTSPDFICLNTGEYYELKTGRSTEYLNLEAFPLMCNQIRSRELGIMCFYVYRGAITNNEIVVCDCSEIRADYLVFPKDEKNDAIKERLERHFKFRSPSVVRERSKIWSNDAYVHVDAKEVQSWCPLNEWTWA